MRVRERFGYKVDDAMWAFFQRLGVIGEDGRPTSRFGDPIWVYLQYCRAKGDRREEAAIRAEGEAQIAECEARGFRQMIAVIGEPANTASIRLHEKFGFHLVGIFRGIAWKHGRWLDTVQMQRPLGAASNEPPHDR